MNYLIILVIIIILIIILLNNILAKFSNNELPFAKYMVVHKYDNKIRLGNTLQDGGYVIANLNNPNYDCYISCGVADEESFSRDFINKYKTAKIDNYAFDGSIDKYPDNFTNEIQFYKKYISDKNDENNTNMDDLINKYNNIFLKMDIEGGEYPWLLYVDENKLNKFKQIIMELHDLNNPSMTETITTCLKKLSNTHYIIHAHANNCCGIQNNMPNLVELTFVHKKVFTIKPELNTTPLPIKNLDFKNVSYNNEIDLNFYPFTN